MPAAIPSYSTLLIVTAAIVLVIVGFYLLRQRWQSSRDGLNALLGEGSSIPTPLHHQLVVPLMLYEERYPTFGRILHLVLERFQLDRFMKSRDFAQSIRFLADAVYKDGIASGDVESAMSIVVREFVSHPEVEYQTRPHLKPLVQEFLDELDPGRDG